MIDVLCNLNNQRNERLMCDVLLCFGDDILFAHACVLAAVSPYLLRHFKSLMSSEKNWSSVCPLRVSLNDIHEGSKNSLSCMPCVEAVIKFIYTNSIEVNSAHISHIRDVISILEIDELKEFLESVECLQFDSSCSESNKESESVSNINLDISPNPLAKLKPDLDKNMQAHEECALCPVAENVEYHYKVHHSKTFDCLYCDFRSPKLICLIDHVMALENHGQAVCSICLHKEIDSESRQTHWEVHLGRHAFLCFHCSAKFNRRADWRRHMEGHARNTEFKCGLCSLCFESRAKLLVHLLDTHKKSRLECSICGYSTRFLSVLNRHLLKHSGKMHECPEKECDFRSARASNLQAHARTHRPVEGKHACPKCGVEFSLERNLRRHMRGHESKRHKCPDCSHVSVRMDRLRAHCMRVHGAASAAVLSSKLPASLESTKSDPSTVFLDDTTGRLSVLCDAQGRPLGEAFSVHSVAGGLSRVTLDPSGEILAVEAADKARGRAAAILDQTTGHVALLDLNLAPYPSKNPVPEVLLDEATGIMTESLRVDRIDSDKIELDQDTLDLDGVDFDAYNDDSFDGFDDFSFDEMEPGSSGCNAVLNEVTGELFPSENCSSNTQPTYWNENSPLPSNLSPNQDISEIILNEVTGELTQPS